MQNIPQEIRLDASYNDCDIFVSKNQILVITLEGNPTTGYTWDLVDVNKQILNQIGGIEFQPSTSAIGSSGIQILRFGVINSGTTILRLAYHRPWETGIPPINTYTVRITAMEG